MAATSVSMSESLHVSMLIQQRIHPQQTDQPPKGLSFFVQVLMVSALFGIEMVIAFEQIYQILFHQFLGVPVSLLSINGIICGAVSMTFLPLLGYYTDRGTNPKRRKLCSLFVGMLTFLSGLLLLVIAGFVKLASLDAIFDETTANNSSNATSAVSSTNMNPLNASLDGRDTLHNSASDLATNLSAAPETEAGSEAQISVTAVLSILAFSCIDIGFDMSISVTRAFILESTPAFQHTRLLVTATVAASIAGTTFSFLGCFDFPGALGPLFQVEGVAATLIFFSILLVCILLTGYICTISTGFIINRKNRDAETKCLNTQHQSNTPAAVTNQGTPNSPRKQRLKRIDKDRSEYHGDRTYNPDILHTEEGDVSTRPLLLEDSLKANNYSAMSISTSSLLYPLDAHDAQFSSKDSHFLRSTTSTTCKPFEDAPGKNIDTELLKSDNRNDDAVENSDEESKQQQTGHGVSSFLDAIGQTYSMSMSTVHAPLGEFHTKKLKNITKKPAGETKKDQKKLSMNKRLVILCCSCFFTFGGMITFIIYISNALNIGIFHGDPTALPGTEAFEYYQAGLRTAALGNTVLYATYMIISINNTRLIRLIGEKVQFVICHVFLIVSLLTLIISQRVEVYFVFMVCCGALRTCVFTLPFVLANKFTQQEEGEDTAGDDAADKPRAHLGKVMSLIGFLIPAHYTLVSIIMGPMMDATGNVWVPLIYSLCSCTISLIIFIPLFFVKN